MDILSTLKKQAEQVEVFSLENEKTTVEYEANQLKACTVTRTKGTAVRVIRKGRLGFSASTDRMAMDKLAANVLEFGCLRRPNVVLFCRSETGRSRQNLRQDHRRITHRPPGRDRQGDPRPDPAGRSQRPLQPLAGARLGLGQYPQPERT